MALFIILILLLAAAAGVLGTVVKLALGVALGLVAAFLFLVWLVRRRIRRALYGGRPGPGLRSGRGLRGPRDARWRKVPGSTIEVMDPSQRP